MKNDLLGAAISIAAITGGAAYGAHVAKRHPSRGAAIGSAAGGFGTALLLYVIGFYEPYSGQVGTSAPPQMHARFP